MGFWKELGVTALEKGKNLFRGGKQAVEGAKHVEGIVKDAKVSIPATTKPTSYRAWEKSLSPPIAGKNKTYESKQTKQWEN